MRFSSSYINLNSSRFSFKRRLIFPNSYRQPELPVRSERRKMKGSAVVEEGNFLCDEETSLTVLKTSLFYAGDGFTVYDPKGQLVFRVDSYGPGSIKGELVLMDACGKCLLTVRRKRPSLHQRWEGFLGERSEGQKPIFSVRRSSMIGRSGLTVDMYNSSEEEYHIEGSYGQKCCTIYNGEKESMAEIRRKVDASTNVMLGKDVFSLCLRPGFDGAFAMGLVLVLDQIYGDEDGVAEDAAKVGVEPTAEDHVS